LRAEQVFAQVQSEMLRGDRTVKACQKSGHAVDTRTMPQHLRRHPGPSISELAVKTVDLLKAVHRGPEPRIEGVQQRCGFHCFCRHEVRKGGVYFSDENGTYFVNAAGNVSLVTGREVRTNGMMLSCDEKTLYLTNLKTLVAFDIQPDGTTTNQRNIGTLETGGVGDGMAIDAEGRLYVLSGGPGIHVFMAEGKYLGVLPLPRSASSVAFAGPGKKVLYAKGAGR
jgi:SMP-30/Gluconolactonase/LRE-like region